MPQPSRARIFHSDGQVIGADVLNPVHKVGLEEGIDGIQNRSQIAACRRIGPKGQVELATTFAPQGDLGAAQLKMSRARLRAHQTACPEPHAHPIETRNFRARLIENAHIDHFHRRQPTVADRQRHFANRNPALRQSVIDFAFQLAGHPLRCGQRAFCQ